MTNKTDNANSDIASTALANTWINQTWKEWVWSDRQNPMKDFTFLKVYNPMIWQSPDIELDWHILAMTEDWWTPFKKELTDVKVLDITKCYKWYANKLENWKPVKDENGNLVKELYYTPEVSVYDKWNIALAKSTDNWPVVLGKWGFSNYLEFTTKTTLPDNTLNPLFDTLGTNSSTWEKYPISIMKQEFYMYFEMQWSLYKIRLWGSYWRWKSPEEWTVLFAKDKGQSEFKKLYPTLRFEFYYLTLKARIEKADKYKYLHWDFVAITETNVLENVTKTRSSLEQLNVMNFPGVSLDNWMETLSYDMWRLALNAWPIQSPIVEWEISIDDVPF